MKKVKFRRSGSAGKGVYIALCAGILAVGAVTFAGYKAAVGSLTKNIIPDVTIQTSPEPDIDTSQVDKILSDIERSEPQSTPDAADIPAPAQTPVDITDELQTLYYEQAKMFPVSGDIAGEYSWGELVKASSGVWRTHDGIDLMADAGSDVKSMDLRQGNRHLQRPSMGQLRCYRPRRNGYRLLLRTFTRNQRCRR